MHRYFCMLDTVDTLPDDNRLVINARTVVNLPQAIAEGIVKDPGDPKEIEKALKQSSDYMELIWMKLLKPDVELTINVETGDVDVYSPKVSQYKDRFTPVELKEHQFSHPPFNAKCLLDQHQQMWFPDRPVHVSDDLQVYQQRFHITNINTSFGIAPEREQYYAREDINWDIMAAKIVTPVVDVVTVSRKCEVLVNYTKDWKKCAGALIKQHPENQLDTEQSSLKYIKDSWDYLS